MTTEQNLPRSYAAIISDHLQQILSTELEAIRLAAQKVADRVERGELVHVYGPGGHSNLAAQEVFFRAGGLVNVSAILDEGTLLSNGALRSVAIERSAGYGRVVIEDNGMGEGDLLLLVNAYGINAALIDAALTSRSLGVETIGISSRVHAESIPADHPARHPGRHNLHDVVDHHVDSKVPVGDAVLSIASVPDPFAAISTYANAFVLQSIMAEAIADLAERGFEPTIWRSANAPGGDERNARFIDDYRNRVRWL